eukprot:1796693-Rhodomonas_salina.1
MKGYAHANQCVMQLWPTGWRDHDGFKGGGHVVSSFRAFTSIPTQAPSFGASLVTEDDERAIGTQCVQTTN